MEQDAVFDLGNYDEKTVNMEEPPRSALHYLQQTAIERSRCSAVVCMGEDFVASVQPSSSKPLTDDIPVATPNIPSEEWCRSKCSLFSQYRSEIEAKKVNCPPVTDLVLPVATDYKQWIKFCGLKRDRPNQNVDRTAPPRTLTQARRPPTIPLILSLSENRINHLVEHLTKFFVENGYSRELFEWFYGVLLVLQNPPPSDECSAIREFAKHAKLLRSGLDQKDIIESTIIHELTLFVAIIGIYFEQKDLADYPQVASVTIS